MAKIETDKLTAEQRKEAITTKDDPMSDAKETAKGLSEPYRSIILLLIAGVGMFGGGAAGQSIFGISEEKLNQTLEQKFSDQDKAIEAKFEILKAQNAGKDLVVSNNTEDIREALTLLRDLDKRLTKLEARRTGGD